MDDRRQVLLFNRYVFYNLNNWLSYAVYVDNVECSVRKLAKVKRPLSGLVFEEKYNQYLASTFKYVSSLAN